MDLAYEIGIALCLVATLVLLIRNWRRLPSRSDDGSDDR